jgi:hypothetical protein
MDTTESSAAHAHPSNDDHDDTVEAHYSALERLRPHACYEGVVYIGHMVEGEDGAQTEIVESMRCERCSTDKRGG